MGSLSFLQGIFLTQEIKPGSPALQADSLPIGLSGKPDENKSGDIKTQTCIILTLKLF